MEIGVPLPSCVSTVTRSVFTMVDVLSVVTVAYGAIAMVTSGAASTLSFLLHGSHGSSRLDSAFLFFERWFLNQK